MNNVILTRELTRQGFTAAEVGRLERNGELVRVRRGPYAHGEAPAEQPDTDDE